MAAETPQQRPTGARDRSLDVAKGLAIAAIVVSHVLRGLASPDTVPRISEPFLEVDDALYSWHIVVFAIVAGAFLPSGVEKRGSWTYVRSRVALFTWLYVLWTVIQAGLKQLESVAGGEAFDTRGFLEAFVTAYGQLWWLAFMVLATVLAAVVRPWRHPILAGVSFLVVGGFAFLVWGWTGPWVFQEGLALLAFFWAGVLAGRPGLVRVTTSGATPWIATLGLGLGVVLLVMDDPMPPTSYLGTRTTLGVVLGVVASTALSVGVLALSGLLARTPLVRPIGLLGQRSLEIFLAHILALTWSRQLLMSLGLDGVAIHLVVGTAVGLLLPLGVWRLGRRVGFPWLFQHPH
ncbi:hypothetical protein N802_01585 [Knoellia sinensis KCTC 19936]|uniref:Acyltransferase 3 domain-containing protein n=1 Tax=Knoellia sinensis KCTC 19936 TaxID=1385520 RepID=A0A0A0JE41_9MICO|nr:acyltransferase [Knoellia sinensis]KGN35029.1 hypothetical protein N802_01585 [Knoellia sinensis KCTC 19936]